MKKGLTVFANLSLLLLICFPAFSQQNLRGVETKLIDDFDDSEAVEWTWNVQASRHVAKQNAAGEDVAYPLLNTFEAIPNSLKILRTNNDTTPKVLGVKVRYERKGDNWFEVYPVKDDEPYAIPFVGTVSTLDFWAWGANYLYFIDILVRDADGTVHILPAGNLAFNGWRNIIVSIPGSIRQHSRLRTGPKTLSFVGFRVTADPGEFADDFTVYFDQLKYTTYALSEVFDGYELQTSDFGDNANATSNSKSTTKSAQEGE